VEDVSAFVLAGGRSSRMGTDKALLPFGEKTLLQLALEKLKSVSPSPIIVGARERYACYGDVIEDRFPGCGPLGGIHAALCTTQTDLNLVLSVDMPHMSPDFLSWLLEIAASGPELAVVPETRQSLQPLCAVYRRAAKCVIEQALLLDDFKVSSIFTRIPTRYIPEDELVSAGFSPEIFINLNTPAEYEAAGKTQTPDPPQVSEGQCR
jgi:molybdopterin-guanine dinucleotide biosynthesis protein A